MRNDKTQFMERSAWGNIHVIYELLYKHLSAILYECVYMPWHVVHMV